MDVFSKIQKKISSSEKKFQNCRFAKCFKARSLPQVSKISPPQQHASFAVDSSEAMIMVERPPPDIRLVLFKEIGDTSDRKIVFDSKCLQKIESSSFTSQGQNNTSGSNGTSEAKFHYQYIRTPSDWGVLSEMLFGSVGMAQKAASLKIHYMKNPPTIMLSRVFCLPSFKDATTVSLDRGMESLEMQRTNSVLSRRKAKTMPVPSTSSESPCSSVASSYSSGVFHRSDSAASLSSFLPNSFTLNTGSLGTNALRMPSNSNGRAHSLPKHQRDSFTLHEESDKVHSAMRRIRMRIGFAVLCAPEPSNASAFQQFFFEHFPIIETHMTRLKMDIETAFRLKTKNDFIEAMMKAQQAFSSKLQVIYSTVRLPEPVWSLLSLPTIKSPHRSVVVDSFVSDLSRLVQSCNTKQKNYFFSGLLTAVLTHHLGWVSSATPITEGKSENDPNVDYNALWAQLGDLYGAVGSPTKVSRTVVTGSGHESVSSILSVLSYFIRSTRVDDVVPVPEKITPQSLGITPPPTKFISLSSVPCEIDDSDYVLVSVTDDCDSAEDSTKNENKEKKPAHSLSVDPANKSSVYGTSPKSAVLRSKSSPQSTRRDGCSSESLSRSHSGPMIKRCNRNRSNAVLESPTFIRNRTFSSTAASKPRSVQSRRTSIGFIDCVTSPAKQSSDNNFFSKSRDSNTTSSNTQGSFCMKIDWPEVPTHIPGEEKILSASKTRKMSTSLQHIPSEKSDLCQLAPSFAERFSPRVERVVNVQRASPHVGVQEVVIPLTDTLRMEKSSNSSPSLQDLGNGRSTPSPHSQKKLSPKPPTRSTSNPSVDAVGSFKPGHKRSSSHNDVKTRVTTRRRPLPTSPPCPERTLEQGSNPSESVPVKSESPSFQRIKLMRIPSVEINHNVFDEYFDSAINSLDSSPLDRASGSTAVLDVIDEQKQASVTHHVASCPNFAQSAEKAPPIPPRVGAKVTSSHIEQGKVETRTSTETKLDIKPIYPDLSDLSPDPITPPVPPPRRPSTDVKKIYPALPMEPNDSFDSVENEERTSFHSSYSQTPTSLQPSYPIPFPKRQVSSQSDATLETASDVTSSQGIELPLANIETAPTPTESEGTIWEAATGFSSLVADYSPEYLNDFILHGVSNQPDIHSKIIKDLSHMTGNSALDEPIAEACCILADTDNWTVKVFSSQRLRSGPPDLPALTSKLVSSILSTVSHMHVMKMSSQFCMDHLENELRQLVLKSRMLAEYVRGRVRVTVSQLSAALGIEAQDLPLLMAIASCHSPQVAPKMMP
ncbi:folliculin-interacting protein 2-like isoform X2 [Clavelina lepadiformis]|uniref:folliculin-interacting protein 2-like isoform X2 n=1 Tax=Clavelina lepadiformis TaxID=159417 RepID=UPI004042C84D